VTTSAGLPDGPRRDGLVRALGAVRSLALAQADEMLGSLPDTGDRVTGRAVDDFVEQAADALRALDEAVARTLADLGSPAPEGAGKPRDQAAYGTAASQGDRAQDQRPSWGDRP